MIWHDHLLVLFSIKFREKLNKSIYVFILFQTRIVIPKIIRKAKRCCSYINVSTNKELYLLMQSYRNSSEIDNKYLIWLCLVS